MSGRTRRFWCAAAVAVSLTAAMPGCYIRRGFAVRWNWSLHAHRYGCHGATCEPDDSSPVVAGPRECADCTAHGGLHGFGGGRAAEGPPPLAPDAEPAGPSYFHPVPTQPVFGPRSEQPDSVEGPTLMPLPVPAQEAEPMTPLLPPPDTNNPDGDEPATDEPPEEAAPDSGSPTGLRRLPKGRETELTGWKAKSPKNRKRTVRSTPQGKDAGGAISAGQSATKKKRPCPHCSVTFKPRPAAATE